MLFQIRQLVLWPRRKDKQPRVLSFQPGSVNVITGASKTGKSAIIPIIDYCLGADKCAIPVKTIRDACSWFGVIVDTAAGQKLLARREPGDQKSTGDMFTLEGVNVTLPSVISAKNTSVEAVKLSLDELAGLSRLDFGGRASAPGQGRPSFRDLAAFMFQPQNIVANPDVFFFKADTYEHREKLINIFPYVLGAITPALLATQYELERLRRDLAKKQRELASIRDVSARWIAEIESKVATARELGLIRLNQPVPAGLPGRVELLKTIAGEMSVLPEPSAASVTAAASELVDLQREEAQVSASLGHLRRRFAEMTRLREAASRHKDAIGIKRDRLKIVEWFQGLHEHASACPVCGNQMEEPGKSVATLLHALQQAELQAGGDSALPAAFDREYQRVNDDIALLAEKLEALSIRRRALSKQSNEVAEQQYRAEAVWRFIGELDEAVKRYESLQQDGDLAVEVARLVESVKHLEAELRRHSVAKRTADALNRVSLYAGRLLPNLDCERPDDAVLLSVKDLTIRVSGGERDDYLWEIGSGANWLSYHVALMLSLQQLFQSLPDNPVPGFLAFDQPSQVYFPRTLTGRDGTIQEPEFRDEDVEAVRKVFEVISRVVGSLGKGLQTLVLDHAPETVWAGIPHVSLVEEWRGGRKLIPEDWVR